MTKVLESNTSGPSTIAQKAAEAALDGPQDCVAEMVAAYSHRRDLAVDLLDEAGLLVSVPHGAFYIMADVSRTGMNARDLALKLVAERGRLGSARHGLRQGRSGRGSDQPGELRRGPPGGHRAARRSGEGVEQLITHIYVAKLKAGTSDDQVATWLQAIDALKIEGMLEIRSGPDLGLREGNVGRRHHGRLQRRRRLAALQR